MPRRPGRATWARTSATPSSWPWPASSTWRPAAGSPTPRCPSRRAQPRPTTSGAGRRAAVARWTRSWRPTGSGARVSWRHFSEVAVACNVPAATVGRFAELVFAYIDELSAASVAGHGDELATTGRVRERYLERLARQLLAGEDASGAGGGRGAGGLGAPAHADGSAAAPAPRARGARPPRAAHAARQRRAARPGRGRRTSRCCWCPTARGRVGCAWPGSSTSGAPSSAQRGPGPRRTCRTSARGGPGPSRAPGRRVDTEARLGELVLTRRPGRPRRPAGERPGAAGRAAPGRAGPAGGDAARVAAAPRPARAGGGRPASSTPRRSATGWGRSGRPSETRSTTRGWSWTSRSPSPWSPHRGPEAWTWGFTSSRAAAIPHTHERSARRRCSSRGSTRPGCADPAGAG